MKKQVITYFFAYVPGQILNEEEEEEEVADTVGNRLPEKGGKNELQK